MQRLYPALAACLLLAAAETARGGGGAPVMEIVSYKLKPGIEQSAYIEAAKATAAYLESTGAVVRRSLTVDSDGLWTDVIHWTSFDAAKAAEAEAMSRPEFAPFFNAADPDSIDMRHAEIVWQME